MGRPHPEDTGDTHPPGGYADSEKTNRKHPLSRLSSCDQQGFINLAPYGRPWVALNGDIGEATSGGDIGDTHPPGNYADSEQKRIGDTHRGHPPGGERSGPPNPRNAPRVGATHWVALTPDTRDPHPPGGHSDPEETNREQIGDTHFRETNHRRGKAMPRPRLAT